MNYTIASNSQSSTKQFSSSISFPQQQVSVSSRTVFSTQQLMSQRSERAGWTTWLPVNWQMMEMSIYSTTAPHCSSRAAKLAHFIIFYAMAATSCSLIINYIRKRSSSCITKEGVGVIFWAVAVGKGEKGLYKFKWDDRIILVMSKQAILLVVDVGSAMDEAFSDGCSRAKMALECCKLTLQQKLFNNANHQLGLIFFGDSESDDGNSLMLHPLEKPKLDLVRKVQQLSDARFDSPRPGGDILSAVNFALGQLSEHCGKRKYNKRVFLFTAGMGETDFDNRDVKTLAGKLESADVKLNLVPVDFMTSYKVEQNELEGEMFMQPIQEKNAQLLLRLREFAPNHVQIFPASLAIELYRRFRKRDTNPVAKFKGMMEIAPGLQVEVSTYKAVRRQKLKSLGRYDASVEFEPEIREKEVILQHNYVVQGDEAGSLIDKEDVINAFSYGPQLVPISSILEAGSKVFEEKNLRFLGFVEKSKIPRHCLMSEVDLVVPADNEVGRKIFTAFVYSMLSLNKYAIARYVSRNCKNGVSPRMVVLIPHRTAEREMFYLVELPTVEDVRDYPFNSLKKSTEGQRELVRSLVDRMMLCRREGEDIEEDVRVENTFNPTRQYFYQTLFYRALNPNAEDIPPLDPVIHNYLTPEHRTFATTEPLMSELKKEFKLIKKLNLEEKNKKKALMWKDIINELAQEKPGMEEESTEEYVKPALKFNAEEEENEARFNPSTPVVSFKRMIAFNKRDLVTEGLRCLSNYVLQRLAYSITSEAYAHLAECALEMRKASVSQQEEEFWDDWLNDLSSSNSKFHDYLRSQGIGLIRGGNVEMFRPASVHLEVIEDEFDLD